MKVVAHRGFSGKYPENTMLAFRKAAEAGCDGIEMDVQLTKDRIPVIMHDETVDRTTDKKGKIRDMNYYELSKLNCSYPAKFGDEFKPEKIPTLEEFFKFMTEEAVSIFTNIELKNSVYYYAGMEEIVIDLIRKYHLQDRIILSSFNNASIMKCAKTAPEIEGGFLVMQHVENAGAYVKDMGMAYYHPDMKFLKEEYVKNCTENGVGVNVWTVNEKEDIRKAKKWGVNSVITNFPDLARAIEDEM